MTSTTTSRNEYVCQDYADGMEINELARTYGVSERRISQILVEHRVPRRPKNPVDKKPVSAQHVRLGLYLYNFRFDRGTEPHEAANALGWSVIKLRKIEKGVTSVELLDLFDIAAYTETSYGELLEKAYG